MQDQIKILIVEDEVLIADYLADLVLAKNFTQVKVAYDSTTAIDKLKTYKPNIVILDINIDTTCTGIELAQLCKNTSKIIYLTAQNDENTVLKALETNPFNYLTKPIREVELITSIKLASQSLKKNYLVKKDGYKEIKILFDDILYIKSDGNYIDIHTTHKTIVLRQSLDAILGELNSEKFKKVHRSYIVNKEKITAKTNQSVLLNTIEIPISRNSTDVL